MDQEKTIYQKLPGTGHKYMLNNSKLYCGQDHILSVNSQGITEDYKRFYFRDIKAIIIRKTSTHEIMTAIYSILFLIILAIAIKEKTSIFFWVLLGIPAVLLVLELFLKATCVCHLLTAVQREELPSLRRIKNARKVIQILKPLIENAQGFLGTDELRLKLAREHFQTMPVNEQPKVSDQVSSAVPGSKQSTIFHLVLFLLMMANGIIIAIWMPYQSQYFNTALSIMYVCISVMTFAAMVAQAKYKVSRDLKALVYAALGYVVSGYLFVNVIGFIIGFRYGRNPNQQSSLDLLSIMNYQDFPEYLGFNIFCMIYSFAISTAGLVIFIRQNLRKRVIAPPLLDNVKKGDTSNE